MNEVLIRRDNCTVFILSLHSNGLIAAVITTLTRGFGTLARKFPGV